MVNDTSENIGSFWYIMLEMFADKLEFMKISFLLQTLFMCVMISMHVGKTYDMLDRQKVQVPRKRESLLLQGLLLIAIVKLVMNQYPCLDDLSNALFAAALNQSFINKHVAALILFQLGAFYAIMNSGFLWITWLKRFSGNANFFYFQTLVL